MHLAVITPDPQNKFRRLVKLPANPDFTLDMADIGEWDERARAWNIADFNERAARDLCREHFGAERVAAPTDTVTVRTHLRQWEVYGKGCAVFAGREIARRPHPRAAVQLAPGVTVHEGQLPDPFWTNINSIGADIGVIVEIADVSYAELAAVNGQDYWFAPPTRTQLRARRAALLRELAELDAQIGDESRE